jgi:hypothetical protein
MVVIGFALLGIGLIVGVMLAIADPVLLSRINGEPAEGESGRFVQAPPVADKLLKLPRRTGERPEAA